MITIRSEQLSDVLDYASLTDQIASVFEGRHFTPERHRHVVEVPESDDATLLIMPSWQTSKYIGVKVATIFPSNGRMGLPSVMATYLLLDALTGAPLATLDGKQLTVLRTAATSALASRFLSRTNARTLLMVGAGALAGPLITAHMCTRNIDRILLWNRSKERMEILAQQLADIGLIAEFVPDLNAAVEEADIISCATLSKEPLILGRHVKPGTHVDLVGAFTPDMRESDNGLIAKSDIFVDTIAGAREEAGDLIAAHRSGIWKFESIQADLSDLVSGTHAGRTSPNTVTVFKSVGWAGEDFAAASLAYERIQGISA